MVKCTHHRNDYSVVVRGIDTSERVSPSWIPGSDKVLMSDNYNSFSDIIKSKLAKDAVIELDGCNTARQWTRGGTKYCEAIEQGLT